MTATGSMRASVQQMPAIVSIALVTHTELNAFSHQISLNRIGFEARTCRKIRGLSSRAIARFGTAVRYHHDSEPYMNRGRRKPGPPACRSDINLN